MEGRGSLVWVFGGRSTVILENKPYKFLQMKKMELKRNPQYLKGKFIITK